MRIVFATNNQDKLNELELILGESLDAGSFELCSLKDLGLKVDAEENGSSYEENALIKARAVYELVRDSIIIADDSGLEIDAMPQELGIHSARFMGYDTDYKIKNTAILNRLSGLEEDLRTARFVCSIAVIFPDGREKTVRGVWEGRIACEIEGEHGFGYDPIFYLPEYSCTSAMLKPELKNQISHRARAIQALVNLSEFKESLLCTE